MPEITETQHYLILGGLRFVEKPRVDERVAEIQEERLALRVERANVNRQIRELMKERDRLTDEIERLEAAEKAITAQCRLDGDRKAKKMDSPQV